MEFLDYCAEGDKQNGHVAIAKLKHLSKSGAVGTSH
jgi:hypothetical protein